MQTIFGSSVYTWIAEAEVLPLREEALHELRRVSPPSVPRAHKHRVQHLKSNQLFKVNDTTDSNLEMGLI